MQNAATPVVHIPANAPVPVRLTVCGLPVALSVIVNEAERVPVTLGLKVTLIVQLLPTATGPAQLLVGAKSPAFVPVTVTLATFKAATLLVSVTVWAALVVPTVWAAKVKVVVDKVTVGICEYANLAESRPNSKEKEQRTRDFIQIPPILIMVWSLRILRFSA